MTTSTTLTFTRRNLLVLVCLMFTSFASASANKVFVPHIATDHQWGTIVMVYTTISVTGSFDQWSGDGTVEVKGIKFPIFAQTWTAVPLLPTNGTAEVSSPAEMLVKLVYTNANTVARCEFMLTGDLAKSWTAPNAVRSDFSSSGLAVANSSSTPEWITIIAFDRNGLEVARRKEPIPARGKFIGTSVSIWNGLPYQNFATYVIESPTPLSAPIALNMGDGATAFSFFVGSKTPFPIAVTVDPPDGTVFSLNQSVMITITATPSSGATIARIEWWGLLPSQILFKSADNVNSLTWGWHGGIAGSFQLQAKVTDSVGNSTVVDVIYIRK